ncbi:acetyltransferase [Cloacibacillus sp. An23]|uniref:acetyltransferase n=1 Tax=Cloacibacillus sp. An23 TaxID=1965591 RepID=UPI000B38D39E|nr:acetyltransferase [Cloacibacillus sp. An23]OUO94343.1 sialic acid O-acetyltransferase [Cloacibacillus sp. An23]
MEKKDKVFLIGAGDHAKVVLSTLEACGFGCAGIYDDNSELWGKSLWCIPILGPVSEMPDTPETMAVIAIGSNEVRRRMAARFKNVCWPVFVHPMGIVHSSVRLGEGTIVFAGCILESDACIGKHTIVNSATYIGHDTSVGSFCHLAPRATIGNNVDIGDDVFIGMGAKVKPYTKIHCDVLVGMGSAVLKDIQMEGTYVGTPARKIMPLVIKDPQ